MSFFCHFYGIYSRPKKCLNQSMNEYIERLHRIGFSCDEAYRIVFDFFKSFGGAELEEYIEELERDSYVCKLQP